ncbi:MAG: PQQ-dependent dehydrogenase, methanol/ethanol family [Luminiphilus sp.]
MKRFCARLFAWLLCLSVIASCSREAPIEQQALAAQSVTTDMALLQNVDWPMKGYDDTDSHFSPLKQISTANIDRLGLAWSLDLTDERGALEATPLAVDGVIYFPGSGSIVYAIDAVSGKQLWKHDPKVADNIDPSLLRFVFRANRGVAYSDNKILLGTNDGRLQALNAKSGELLWSVRTFPEGGTRFISGVPRVFKNKVLIGHGGGDWGNRGYVTAYDIETGKQAWRFYTAPGSPEENAGDPVMEMAAETWSGEYWKTGTGGTVWHGITYDEELDQLYIGTGNSSPYNPEVRSPGGGDNLFLVSIVALDPDTGDYLWHYQMNPREAWDYKSTADIVLTDLILDGEQRKVLMQAPTNGFFYVIDRLTGKVISAEKLGKVTWAERIDLETGRPVEVPNIRYETGSTLMWPSIIGAHSWQSMSYNPQTGLVYIPYMQLATHFFASDSDVGGVSTAYVKADEDDGTGTLIAWDPVQQEAAWSVQRESMWHGGIISTAGGLVFQGTESGHIEAYDARLGKKLWSFEVGQGIVSSPITYMVDGRQYISVLVGYGGIVMSTASFNETYWDYRLPRRLLTFALDGKVELDTSNAVAPAILDDEALVIDEVAVDAGISLYDEKLCVLCHGRNAKTVGGQAPDLRRSAIAMSPASLGEFLKGGGAGEYGMPTYPEITDEEVNALYMLIRAAARESLGKREPKPVVYSDKGM